MRKYVLSIVASAALAVGAMTFVGDAGAEELQLRNYNTVELDNFDTEGYWTAKYSRFRSLNWESTWGNIPNYHPVYSEPADREVVRTPNADWLRWIGNGDGYDVVPTGLVDMHEDQGTGKILGVRGNWDFPGYNWVMIEPSFTHSGGLYPTSDLADDKFWCSDGTGIKRNAECAGLDYLKDPAQPPQCFLLHEDHYNPANPRPKLLPNYIQMPGRAEAVDFWVWGKGYNYDLEMHVEDFHGNAHVLTGPRLNFFGWRNVRFEIPRYIHQTQRYLPQNQGIKFLRFKVTAQPSERPDDFYVYFDYMQVLTDLYVHPFFGDDLIRHSTWN